MADTPRVTDADLNDQQLEATLIARAPSFSFFQALRLLRQIAGRRGHDPYRSVRVRPGLNMSRPQSSVVRISRLTAPSEPRAGQEAEQEAEQGRTPSDKATEHCPQYEIETGFLGLYGASSPLPNFYTEDLILAEQEDQNGARAFLDVFQQRLYDLYLQAQEKHRPLYDLTEAADSQLLEVLWSLIGLRAPALRQQLPDSRLLLRYLSLFASSRRSASGLQAMLEDFTGSQVAIKQCVRRSFQIPFRHRFRLGEAGHCLGEGCVLGSQATDFSGRIEVVVGPLSHAGFSQLMNQDQHWSLMISLISYYLKTPLQCDLLLLIEPGDARPAQLGSAQWGCLGQNAWLYEPPKAGARTLDPTDSIADGDETLTARIAIA